MKPSAALAKNRDEIKRAAAANRARNPRVFGSAANGTDSDGSDLDILIDPAAEMTLLDLGAIRHQLKILLRVDVDVLTPGALPSKFRERVLSEAVPI